MKVGLENRTQLKEVRVGEKEKKRSIALTSKHRTLLSPRE